MIEFETVKSNLDVEDSLGVEDINIDKCGNYRGSIDIIKKSANIDDCKTPPLAGAIVGINNTDAPLPSETKSYTAWTDIDAQELYINSKPTCYLILSKPGTGACSLGEAISKKFSCIHLCPRNVIIDEIEQNSPTGHCLDFNMRHNKSCKFNEIWLLIEEKLKSPAVQHRGYVMSGIPLVSTSWGEKYFIDSLNGEESLLAAEDFLADVIANLKKKKTKKKKREAGSMTSISSEGGKEEEEAEEEHLPEEEENPEEEEQPVELPNFLLDTCSDLIFRKNAVMDTKKVVLIKQFQEVINLSMKPDIIIYITCPDKDAVFKKDHTYLNYKKNSSAYVSVPGNIPSDLRWPMKYTKYDSTNRYDNKFYKSKYDCRQPMNFKEFSVQQMCNYRNNLLTFIESKLKESDPKNIIKVDGRTTVHQMMDQISEILTLLSVNLVLIPEPMRLEEPPEEIEEFWQLVGEMNVIQSNGVTFGRYASLWYNRCPVELKNRQSTRGNPKFAATFFKHAYLMSSLQSLIQFCRNPRPFLKLKYLEPTCRVIVIGTKSAGKTMISKCLEWIFDASYIFYKPFFEKEKQKKFDTYARSILSEIIATIEDARIMVWQATESDRVAKMEAWYDKTQNHLLCYFPLLVESLLMAEEDENGEEEDKNIEEHQPDPELSTKLNELRNLLSYLPFVDDVEQVKLAISDKSILLFHCPVDLITPTERPAMPIIGDADVTEAVYNYIELNELQNEIEPTTEEIMTELATVLGEIDAKTAEETNNEHKYGKWVIDGFPSDAEFWDYLSESKFVPDYTISLIENREIEPELIQHYAIVEASVKNHEGRFLLADDPLIKLKLSINKSLDVKLLDVQVILNDYLNSLLSSIFDEPREDAPDVGNEITILTESIDQFRENWNTIRAKLEDSKKCFIEVELENKSDVQVTEEVLMKLRQCYYLPCAPGESEGPENIVDEEEAPKDLLEFNIPYFLCETNIYCPVAYYDHGVLWEGKPEFSIKYDNKMHLFSKEECLNEIFSKDVTKYQAYNKPFKCIPCLRVCVIGCIGSGKSTISKYVAKELGLIHVDFAEIVNDYLMPRHFKKVGRKYENSFESNVVEEEAAAELQMDEEDQDLEAGLLSNEKELRRMVVGYFEQGSPLPTVLLRKLLKKLWFEKPFSNTGFVLDGFPRMSTDVEDMMTCYCIPDLIVDLESNSENAVERLSPIMFKRWKMQMNEAKKQSLIKFTKQKQDWLDFITKEIVCKLVFEEILDMVVPPEDLPKTASNESTVFNVDPSVTNTKYYQMVIDAYNDMVQEYPEPVNLSEWEKPDEVLEGIEGRIEGIFEADEENISAVRDIISEQRIKTITINVAKPLYKVVRIVLDKLAIVRKRCISLLEQTFILSPNAADTLLSEGIYFLSKFKRMCPVHIFEHPNILLNPYDVMKSKNMIYPVGHRSYIYFISGIDNVLKFRSDPLKYINSKNIDTFILYPLRFSVIGSPKSGKSCLTMKLAKKYGLLPISKGMALRYVLDNMNWTELASKMLAALKEGDCIGTDFIIKAIQIVAMDHRSFTNGFVFDGFPENPPEAMELLNNGLYPLVVFDISSDIETILENSQNEVFWDILKYKPPYSRSFVEYRYNAWLKKCNNIRNWVNDDLQNICVLKGNESRWKCLQDAIIRINWIKPRIHHYLAHFDTDIVSAEVMCISNQIFNEQMSRFKNVCPACLHENVLRHSSFPVDKKGVVRYKNLYYWICSEHMSSVFDYPDQYLTVSQLDIPEMPVVVKTVNVSLVYENGVCIVSYAESLPAQIIERGSSKFAASFHGNTYLFCSEKCLKKFMAKPQLYHNITVFKHAKPFTQLPLKTLPNIGYLEQTLGNLLTEACCAVNVLRPKYPGLSLELSGLLFIALYLKTHNDNLDKTFLPKYLKAFIAYEARCKLMINVGLRMRSMENPFSLHAPKCCSGAKKKHMQSDKSNLKASRVPVPDERYDFLCEYHKPASKVPAFLNVVDIAGLVKGAAEGQGLGNAFLSHIKACDAIFNLCRAFDDEDVIHVDGEVNPVRDLETIGEELRLKDEEQLMAALDKLERTVSRGGDKKLKPEYDCLLKLKTHLVDEKKHIRFGDWSAADIEVLNRYLFITSKPALYLVNLSEKDYIRKKNKWLPKLKEWIDKNDPGAPLVPFSGALETKLMDMEPAERQAFLKEHGITSALDKIIVQGYKALQLEYFFTAGVDEVKAWTIQKGTKAPQAAGRIHTDFEKGFIMAEVMHFKDFKEEGSESACKSAGKYRQQGRNYVVEDGDIIFFKFNAGAGIKDAKKK